MIDYPLLVSRIAAISPDIGHDRATEIIIRLLGRCHRLGKSLDYYHAVVAHFDGWLEVDKAKATSALNLLNNPPRKARDDYSRYLIPKVIDDLSDYFLALILIDRARSAVTNIRSDGEWLDIDLTVFEFECWARLRRWKAARDSLEKLRRYGALSGIGKSRLHNCSQAVAERPGLAEDWIALVNDLGYSI